MSISPLQTQTISNTQKKELEGLLEQLMGMKGVRHAIMTVESRDNSFSWSGARGIANPDGTPMEINTPFWIASVTKLYIASSILKLHEMELLSIDDFVIDYLPENLLKGVHVINGKDYYDLLTIRHLLSHSSGIPDYLEIKVKGEQTLVDQVLEGSDKAWSLEDTLEIVRKVNKPLFPPQNLSNKKYRIRYSDTNFQMLIAIIEVATNKSIEAVYNELIFQPLHLEHTFLPGSKPQEPLSSVATAWIQDTPFDNKPLAMRAFGDLNSTVKDLIVFMRALLDGKVFDKRETLDLMLGMWQTFGFGFSLLAPGWPIQYGLGMMRFKLPRFFTPFHPMPEVIGHTGAVGSWLFYCPQLDIISAGTVSQVTAAPAPFKIIPKLLQILEKDLK
ncbi:class A beta-lactamase-related serine hydrolase [Bacillus sp. HMF5848]|uniref:serine hydrolase domain-containing protein n=1 Tax=Bacillus sp. HMF5848 TaxID=2495421 RepID=UPI000F7B43DC|nr:serine hydrolase domain-containing protein [Bacillus sp. HMF5848]RSK26099.1 class A beta-lactamase-related serine hydrolase [Bacillus sp. HMF5848]